MVLGVGAAQAWQGLERQTEAPSLPLPVQTPVCSVGNLAAFTPVGPSSSGMMLGSTRLKDVSKP